MVYSCPFSPNVDCSKADCLNCGWNPVVSHQRLEEIKKKLGVETDEEKSGKSNKRVYG